MNKNYWLTLCSLGLVMFLATACASKAEKADWAAIEEIGFEEKEVTKSTKQQEEILVPTVMAAETEKKGNDSTAPTSEKPSDEGETKVVEAYDLEMAEEEIPVEPKLSRPSARLIPVHYNIFNYMSGESKELANEFVLSEISKEIAGKVSYELGEERGAGLDAKVAVVAAVPLADFKRDTELGRLVAEFLLTDLADRGLQVTELRIGREINILPQTGEFILSRNIGELANKNPEIDYVVVSTFSNTKKTLILQGRLVDLENGLVKTSWRHTMPLNRELLSLFRKRDKPFTIAVKGLSK